MAEQYIYTIHLTQAVDKGIFRLPPVVVCGNAAEIDNGPFPV